MWCGRARRRAAKSMKPNESTKPSRLRNFAVWRVGSEVMVEVFPPTEGCWLQGRMGHGHTRMGRRRRGRSRPPGHTSVAARGLFSAPSHRHATSGVIGSRRNRWSSLARSIPSARAPAVARLNAGGTMMLKFCLFYRGCSLVLLHFVVSCVHGTFGARRHNDACGCVVRASCQCHAMPANEPEDRRAEKFCSSNCSL